MYVDEHADHRPAAPAGRFGLPEALGGTASSALGVAFVLALGLLPESCAGSIASAEAEPPPVLEEVIAAELVQLGRQFDELPNREVPQLPTNTEEPVVADAPQVEDPDPGIAVSEDAEPSPPTPETERRPAPSKTRSLEDLLARSEAFAEIAEAREREGDPDGVEGGVRNVEGDDYAGRFTAFFRRGWTVPTTLPEDVLRELQATAIVTVGEDLRIASFSLARSSGDPDFDESVRAQLNRLQVGGVSIPEPPLVRRPEYVGRARPVRFLGRNARR
ncbi:MAG: TonB C-terminal domain-containing protein [Myxococcota bacterium]